MNKKQNAAQITLEKSRLNQARALALGRNDRAEVAEIDAQLALLNGEAPARPRSSQVDELAKLNERNRKANIEAARKAEMLETERKRRERKLAHASGTATPDRIRMLRNGDSRFVLLSSPLCLGVMLCYPILITLSMLCLFVLHTSRPGTPVIPGTKTETGSPAPPGSEPPESTKPSDPSVNFETAVLDDVEIDLGDF